MNRDRSPRLTALAAGVTLALLAAGCTSAGANKGNGGTSEMLTLADVESDASSVQPYADAVKAVSNGALQIQVKLNWGAAGGRSEGGLISDVEQSKAELGVAPVRAFDTVGIDSFQALQAPFLIDSYALEKQVLASEIPAKMLGGMGSAGLLGLAVLPGDLRKPLGLTRPLVAAPDYRGARVGIRPGKVAEATMRSLGATPATYVPGDVSGLDGMEVHVGTIPGNNYDQNATELTGNVNFWPKASAVFIGAKAFDALSPQQRAWLREAGPRSVSAAWSNVTQTAETAAADILCNRGLTIVTATADEMAQLRLDVQPVYDEIEQSSQTRALVEEITTMRAGMVDSPDSVSPCGGSPEPKTTRVTALDGTWEVTITRQELLAAGIHDPGEDIPENYGHLTLTFHKGDWDAGTYVVDGNTLILTDTSTGEVWSMTWSIYRNQLTLKGRLIPTDFRVKPWQRVGP